MPERIIEKIESKEFSNIEKLKESENDVFDPEQEKEIDKEDVRKRVYEKGNELSRPDIIKKPIAEEKIVSRFVKEFYSIGVKAIEKAKKILRPDELDDLHDDITNRNKGNKDTSH